MTVFCFITVQQNITYSTAAKQGPHLVLPGQDSPFSQCQRGEKLMPAYLVCCHTTVTEHTTWANWEFLLLVRHLVSISLSSAVCIAISGSYHNQRHSCHSCLSQIERRHRCQANMNESHRGWWEKALRWVDSWNVVGTLEACLQDLHNFTVKCSFSLVNHLPDTRINSNIWNNEHHHSKLSSLWL